MLRTLTLLTALTLCAPAFAQSNAEAMQRLASFQGTYALDGTAQIEEGTYGGTLTISPILGGHFQEWNWEMDMEGGGFEEKVHLRFIVAFDQATNEYAIFRFDSRDADSSTRVSSDADPHRGRLYFDGDALVMAWPTAAPDDPTQTGSFRNTVHLRPSGLHIVTDVRPDDGAPLVAIATTRAARR